MGVDSYNSFSTNETPQSEKIPGREEQIKNDAGGYVFEASIWDVLDRFLILGTESPTYYSSQKDLFSKAANGVIKCIKADGIRTVNRIVEISLEGRAPKNDPALFALAMCTSTNFADKETRKLAFGNLDKVARIGTHLFHFCKFREQFGGWGRGMREAVANWYTSKETDKLAYQVIKYQQRDGWSHRDCLRLSHPKYQPIFNYITKGKLEGENGFDCPNVIQAFEQARKAKTELDIVVFIRDCNLPRECISTEFLGSPVVWEALLDKMPITAMIRNIATMTKIGLISPMSNAVKTVVERLHDQDRLVKGRVHPIQILAALKTYQQGHGMRGKGEWTPVPQVIDALDDSFYLTFKNIEPTGKRILIGLDVSGSMSMGEVAAIPGLTPREGAAAMCLVTAKSEINWHIMAFQDRFIQLPISTKQRLDDVCKMTYNLPFGRTDCAQPMVYALNEGIDVDCFIIYTDNETWCGRIHPTQALQKYRQKTGINAKLIVVSMEANNFTIADPKDNGMMDVVGFDTAVPQLMANFMG